MTKILRSVVAIALLGAAHANAFILNNTNSGDGYVMGSFPSFTLVGSDNGADVSSITTYVDSFASAGQMTFAWSYATDDWDSVYDPAGYVLNNIYTQLTPATSGTLNLSLAANDVFGWYVESTDNDYGSAYLTVVSAEFIAVPEPASVALLGLGLFGLGWARRRKIA